MPTSPPSSRRPAASRPASPSVPSGPLRAPQGAPQPALQYLRALPFAEYAALVARLLERMGYRDVTLMGATHAHGRNAYGGLDIRASAGAGPGRTLAIAQVKQYQDPVPRAFVDELRGTALRLGARQALLVTTGAFPRTAVEAAEDGQDALPVRLVAGNELAALLRRYGLVGAPGSAPRSAPLPRRPEPHAGDAETLAPPQGPGTGTPPSDPWALPIGAPGRCDEGVTLTLTLELSPDSLRRRERP